MSFLPLRVTKTDVETKGEYIIPLEVNLLLPANVVVARLKKRAPCTHLAVNSSRGSVSRGGATNLVRCAEGVSEWGLLTWRHVHTHAVDPDDLQSLQHTLLPLPRLSHQATLLSHRPSA